MDIQPLPAPNEPMSLIELMLLASAAPATMVQYYVVGDSMNNAMAVDHAACAVRWVTEVRSKQVTRSDLDLRYVVVEQAVHIRCSECGRNYAGFIGAQLMQRA